MSDKEFEIDKIRATQEVTIFDADMSGPHVIFMSGISKWSNFKDAKLKKVDWIGDEQKPE